MAENEKVASPMKNPGFLNKHNGFNVIGKTDMAISITERFFPPEHKTGEVRQFDVIVRVDLVSPRFSRYLKISARQLGNAASTVSDPSELGIGYPWDAYHHWVSLKGETFLSWTKRLSASEIIRPINENWWQRRSKKKREEIQSLILQTRRNNRNFPIS